MRIAAVLCLVLVNAGALLLFAPTSWTGAHEANGLDPAYVEFAGWALLGGGQILLLVVVKVLTGSLQTVEHQYLTLSEAKRQTELRLAEAMEVAELSWERKPRLLFRFLKLRKKCRKLWKLKEKATLRRHRLEVEAAGLRQLRSYLTEAWNDEDNAAVVAQLQQEMARLRATLATAIPQERYENLFAEYHELKGRIRERDRSAPPQENPDVQAIDSASTPVNTDQAVS